MGPGNSIRTPQQGTPQFLETPAWQELRNCGQSFGEMQCVKPVKLEAASRKVWPLEAGM